MKYMIGSLAIDPTTCFWDEMHHLYAIDTPMAGVARIVKHRAGNNSNSQPTALNHDWGLLRQSSFDSAEMQ